MKQDYKALKKIRKEIRLRTDFEPKAALVLGSGLGSFAEKMTVVTEIPYSELPGFPVSTAPGHDGRFIFGYVSETPVVCMKGRVHLYEGYTPWDVVLPIRVMGMLGAEVLFLTNASGGIDASFKPGDLCMITDHISSFVPNPLIGPNLEKLGVRFPDMTEVYDRNLQYLLREAAQEEGIDLKEGIYVQTTGPSFESPSEIRMFDALGASLVGMSTVVEAIAARHMGMRVMGVSLVSNLAAGISDRELSSEEVNEAGEKAADTFGRLVTNVLSKL